MRPRNATVDEKKNHALMEKCTGSVRKADDLKEKLCIHNIQCDSVRRREM